MNAEVEVNVERLDCDVIDEHLRTSTLFLHDIMSQDREFSRHADLECPEPKDNSSAKKKKRTISVQKHSPCRHCPKIYKNQTALQRHVLLEHAEEEKSKCDKCDRTYPSRLSLEKHARYMHLRHRCAVCYRTFENTDLLSQHSEGCKKAEVACEVCGNYYASLVSLRNHVKYMHPSKTEHWCAICRRQFVSEANFLNHRNTAHPVGAMDCACGLQFPSLARLQSHVLYKHTEDRHKCHHCHKAFTTATRLERHLARVHV